MKNYTVEEIELSSIRPDPNNPRKKFDATGIANLATSIKEKGIKNPLTVEKTKQGWYMLIDGERRFRAATELGLKVVPVFIRESQSDQDRLIEQFHLQEQHEAWSPLEKARAVGRLAKLSGLDVATMARQLSLPPRTVADYANFAKLAASDQFAKSEIPLSFASPLNSIGAFVRKTFLDDLKEDFTKEEEAELQVAIIGRIRSGEITKSSEITKLRDSVKSDPKIVKKFVADNKLTLNQLFVKTDAKAAHHYRNVRNTAYVMATHIRRGMELNFEGFFMPGGQEHNALKEARARIDELLKKI